MKILIMVMLAAVVLMAGCSKQEDMSSPAAPAMTATNAVSTNK